MVRDLRTLIYLLNLELQADACNRSGRDREQQLKWTQVASVQQQLKRAQSGSTAGSRRKRGAAVEAMQSGSGAAADLKRTQSGSSSSAQRAVRRRITHGRRTRGGVAERAKQAKLLVVYYLNSALFQQKIFCSYSMKF